MPRPPLSELPTEGIVDTRERRADLRPGQASAGQGVEAIPAKLVVHGHWHHAYELERNETTIKDLDCDDTDQAVALLDLNTLEDKDWNTSDPARCW